ncbi:MAG: hypothetical protein E7C47_10345 [Veillonella sp.]|uniref:hypothetical protein n=1 Tax=Veillonella sp. TaxID=1926307 RepID=UPI0029000037|nr:hypothetical protein [Veillonella sp.]MDU2702524.1 hypothetical protein [Veillonella sp.]
MVEVKKIEENVTEIKFSNKQNKFHIEQLKFIGAKPIKESSRYTCFRFNGNFLDCQKYLGIG